MEYSISAACKRAVSQSEAQRRTRRRRMPLSRDLLIGLALGSLATYFHLESRPSDGRQLQAEPPPSCRISTLPESRLPWSAADQARALKALDARKILGPVVDSIDASSRTLCAPDANGGQNDAGACRRKAGHHHVANESNVWLGQASVLVNDKVLSVDDVVYGFEKIFQARHLHSFITYGGVGMQQHPIDAIVIADLLWRVRPRLLIELGTSGGGGALWYARTMLEYDPEARVLTIDPADGKKGATKYILRPLQNWNHVEMHKWCHHCTAAKDHVVWRHAVRFLNEMPTAAAAVRLAETLANETRAAGYPVLVVDDGSHLEEPTLANLQAYAHLVTPGSYLVVQDTRGGRFTDVQRATRRFLSGRNDFVADRRLEYFLYSQHSGGFLRRTSRELRGDF